MDLLVKYICQSKTCRIEREIETPLDLRAGEIQNPKCDCGSNMKKVYSKPVLLKFSKAEAIRRFDDLEAVENRRALIR